jgi:lysozyme
MPTTIKDLMVSRLNISEGRRRLPYRDTKGKLTIGVGFNLDDVGLYDDEIDFILKRRIERAMAEAAKLPVYPNLSPARKSVIVDMVFNMGLQKVLGFKNMLSNLKLGIWDLAAQDMLNSEWADEVGNRAIQLAEVMKSGQVKNAPDLVE